jgi:hypothetical protein
LQKKKMIISGLPSRIKHGPPGLDKSGLPPYFRRFVKTDQQHGAATAHATGHFALPGKGMGDLRRRGSFMLCCGAQ